MHMYTYAYVHFLKRLLQQFYIASYRCTVTVSLDWNYEAQTLFQWTKQAL